MAFPENRSSFASQRRRGCGRSDDSAIGASPSRSRHDEATTSTRRDTARMSASSRGGLDDAVTTGAVSRPRRSRMKKDISSLRSTLEYLDAIGELVTTDVEVDPHLEVAAIQKHFDGGAALLFNKVKGYPNARICNNIFASGERVSRLFGVEDPRKFKFRAVEALRNPIPPVEVTDGPCQEVVLTKNFDV